MERSDIRGPPHQHEKHPGFRNPSYSSRPDAATIFLAPQAISKIAAEADLSIKIRSLVEISCSLAGLAPDRAHRVTSAALFDAPPRR